MNYYVTLDRQLGLSAFDFIITWNATPECRAWATARTAPATPARFNMDLITGNKILLSGVATEAGEALYALVRMVLEKRGIRQRLELTQTDLPDVGRGILVSL